MVIFAYFDIERSNVEACNGVILQRVHHGACVFGMICDAMSKKIALLVCPQYFCRDNTSHFYHTLDSECRQNKLHCKCCYLHQCYELRVGQTKTKRSPPNSVYIPPFKENTLILKNM